MGEQQLKQQLMQKKKLCKISRKKKKVQFFPSYHSQKIVPTIKNKHHPTPSYQKVAYTFQNDVQSYQKKNCTKAFYEKKRKSVCAKSTTKKNIDEIPPIHIIFYLKSSSLICQSYISISLLILSTHVCASMFKTLIS